jgi:hypothetical protein
VILSSLKKYIAIGKEPGGKDAANVQRAMSVKVDPGMDYAPVTSC